MSPRKTKASEESSTSTARVDTQNLGNESGNSRPRRNISTVSYADNGNDDLAEPNVDDGSSSKDVTQGQKRKPSNSENQTQISTKAVIKKAKKGTQDKTSNAKGKKKADEEAKEKQLAKEKAAIEATQAHAKVLFAEIQKTAHYQFFYKERIDKLNLQVNEGRFSTPMKVYETFRALVQKQVEGCKSYLGFSLETSNFRKYISEQCGTDVNSIKSYANWNKNGAKAVHEQMKATILPDLTKRQAVETKFLKGMEFGVRCLRKQNLEPSAAIVEAINTSMEKIVQLRHVSDVAFEQRHSEHVELMLKTTQAVLEGQPVFQEVADGNSSNNESEGSAPSVRDVDNSDLEGNKESIDNPLAIEENNTKGSCQPGTGDVSEDVNGGNPVGGEIVQDEQQ